MIVILPCMVNLEFSFHELVAEIIARLRTPDTRRRIIGLRGMTGVDGIFAYRGLGH